MAGIADIIIPIFLLIAFGYGAARANIISTEGGAGLNDFVLYFCIPPLLFKTMQSVDLSLDPRGVWGAFYGGLFTVWIIVLALARRLPGLGDAGGAATAFGATFGNIGMMGLAIAYLGFGDAGVITAALIITIHTAIHWGFCTLWAEFARAERGVDVARLLRGVGVSLVKNPILISLAVGAAWNAGGYSLPGIANTIIDMAADAAIPTGLFALGLRVAGQPLRGNIAGVATIISLKMIVMPFFVFLLARFIFTLPAQETALLTLLAAMPTGINPYLFAGRFNASVAAVAGAIALGVMLSMITLPLLLALLNG